MTVAPPLHLKSIEKLLAIMAQLRNPDGGCPWDLEQNFASIAPYTIEEAYEVADAVTQKDMSALCEELGDLLLQVVFHAQMASEANLFNFADVAEAISAKMIARHPHVFGESATSLDSQDVLINWEKLKAAERQKKGAESALDGVALGLPALMRAEKLQKRAAKAGIDCFPPMMNKVEEELAEVKAALAQNDPAAIKEEIGDLLFSVVNLARSVDVDAEEALRAANAKFDFRFRYMETALKAKGQQIQGSEDALLESLWQEAKTQQKQS